MEPYIIKEVGGLDIGIIGVTSLKPQDRGWEEVSDKVFESGDITVTNLMEEVAPTDRHQHCSFPYGTGGGHQDLLGTGRVSRSRRG